MAAVKVQTGLPTPDHYTIRGHLQSARAILEHATDRAAAAASLICFGTCTCERTKRLIASRVHDRAAALCLGLTPAPAARKIQTRQQGGNAERAAAGHQLNPIFERDR